MAKSANRSLLVETRLEQICYPAHFSLLYAVSFVRKSPIISYLSPEIETPLRKNFPDSIALFMECDCEIYLLTIC